MWAKFLDKLKEPMVALLLGSACVSLLTKQYDDAISISLVSVRSARWAGGGGKEVPVQPPNECCAHPATRQVVAIAQEGATAL